MVAALLLALPGLGGCTRPAPGARGGAAERTAGAGRNDLVVGFLPVT